MCWLPVCLVALDRKDLRPARSPLLREAVLGGGLYVVETITLPCRSERSFPRSDQERDLLPSGWVHPA